MKKSSSSYVVCIRAEPEGDLEVRKLYRVIPDPSAGESGYIRVVDESGEDYLYPEEWFVGVEVPEKLEAALAAASGS